MFLDSLVTYDGIPEITGPFTLLFTVFNMEKEFGSIFDLGNGFLEVTHVSTGDDTKFAFNGSPGSVIDFNLNDANIHVVAFVFESSQIKTYIDGALLDTTPVLLSKLGAGEFVFGGQKSMILSEARLYTSALDIGTINYYYKDIVNGLTVSRLG